MEGTSCWDVENEFHTAITPAVRELAVHVFACIEPPSVELGTLQATEGA